MMDFRFSGLRVFPFEDPDAAAADVRAQALVKSTGRVYRQEYMFILRAKDGKIA